jgi:hypothetical protein
MSRYKRNASCRIDTNGEGASRALTKKKASKKSGKHISYEKDE